MEWELKRAGFDEIIVEGMAKSPVYLWIKDGEAELKDARHLWGMEVAPTHFALQEELGDRMVRTAVIGPGGERLIRFASISNDITHVAGRTGMGAVMGSKKLKAIAVRGRAEIPMANEKSIRDLGTVDGQEFQGENPDLEIRDGSTHGGVQPGRSGSHHQFQRWKLCRNQEDYGSGHLRTIRSGNVRLLCLSGPMQEKGQNR